MSATLYAVVGGSEKHGYGILGWYPELDEAVTAGRQYWREKCPCRVVEAPAGELSPEDHELVVRYLDKMTNGKYSQLQARVDQEVISP